MSLNNEVNSNGQNHNLLLTNEQQSEVKTSIRRNPSFGHMDTSAEANVLVIYTGGTIGMTRNSNNGE